MGTATTQVTVTEVVKVVSELHVLSQLQNKVESSGNQAWLCPGFDLGWIVRIGTLRSFAAEINILRLDEVPDLHLI